MFQLPPAEIERFRTLHRRLHRDQQLNEATNLKVEGLDVDEGRTRKIPVKWHEKQLQRHQPPVHHHDDGMWPESAGTEKHLGFNAFDFAASPESFYDETEELKGDEAVPSIDIKDLQPETFFLDSSELPDESWTVSTNANGPKQLPVFQTTPEPQLALKVLPMTKHRQQTPMTKHQQQTTLHMTDVAKQVTSMGFNSVSLWERKFPNLPRPGGLIRNPPSLGQSGRWEAPVHCPTCTPDEQRRALYYR